MTVHTPDVNKLNRLTGGYATYRYLSGSVLKEKAWIIGVLRGRPAYESWATHLSQGLQDPQFLKRFASTNDPWERSKLVGQRVSQLRKSYWALTDEQRHELARQAEIELKAGLELLNSDKKEILDLLNLADPPTVK
jgi:hypothetical protein